MWGAIIAAGAAIIGALISAGKDAEAAAIRQSIADKYRDLPLPQLDKAVSHRLPPEAAARYEKATQATKAQSDVLGRYQEILDEKGETADDRAAYLRMRNAAAGIASGAQSAVQRGMANRGLGGSGMAFALEQQGAQAAANRANEMGINEASDARARYMDALGKTGGLATSMRGQEQDAMRAQDAINMFNSRDDAATEAYNLALPQRGFDNSMTKLAGESNASAGVANDYNRAADATRQTAGGIGSAAITAGEAWDERESRRKKYKDSAGGDL